MPLDSCGSQADETLIQLIDTKIIKTGFHPTMQLCSHLLPTGVVMSQCVSVAGDSSSCTALICQNVDIKSADCTVSFIA